jgi:hypothetical protein
VEGLAIPDLDPSFPYEKLEIYATDPIPSSELMKLGVYTVVDLTNQVESPEFTQFPVFYGTDLSLEGYSLAQWNHAMLPNLKVLRLVECSEFSSLPEMPVVESVFIDYCEDLTRIPTLPSLEELKVCDCDNFQLISFCAKLRTVEFLNCSGITDISSCSHVKSVRLHDCPRISADCQKLKNVTIFKSET